ncbi:MAG: PqqD family protein [Candidatus Gastranaerophilales bacterium]|nr:PqqD family protein [Candidatus Gastranaerophilales bacterium]
MRNPDETGASSYQLRYAAGLYWLLDMKQSGVPYRRPLAVNEVGADIWRLLEQGVEAEQIAERLAAEYQVSRETVREDIAQFRQRLEQAGIRVDS